MPYSDDNMNKTNINYLTKDFTNLKSALVNYAKTYFPNTYRDFNETSPGMMLIEMSAYVGDVLSFYIDQQFKEMLLPLAEERKNVINLANMLGYKITPVVPSYVDLQVTTTISADTSLEDRPPKWSEACILDKGAKVASSNDSNLIFETTEVCDFTTLVSGSIGVDYVVSAKDTNGLINSYKLIKKVPAVAGQTTSKTFTVGAPKKFLRLTIDSTNVTEILKVEDGNGNQWYRVDYLAQDKVPRETFYRDDGTRLDAESTNNAYFDPIEDSLVTVNVPYSLEFIKTTKRFTTEVNEDNTTSLLFGNGILRNGQTVGQEVYNTEQAGMLLPGNSTDFTGAIDPMLNDVYGTLGESPSNTTITVTYRYGGGLASNVVSKDLISFTTYTDMLENDIQNLTVTNPRPAAGGANSETIEEIRQRAKANFATQNRVVTRRDYEARTLNMPSRFGSIAKVYANRIGTPDQNIEISTKISNIIQGVINNYPGDGTDTLITESEIAPYLDFNDDGTVDSVDLAKFNNWLGLNSEISNATIELYLLSYDSRKNLVYPTSLLVQNLMRYLDNYKILTDDVSVMPGYIINFGVVFDVLAQPGANKKALKLDCIETIRKYFLVEKMQFNQPIYTSAIEHELMKLPDIRAINFVRLTQDEYFTGNQSVEAFQNPLYDQSGSGGSPGQGATYQWKFDFTSFYADGAGEFAGTHGDGVILPSKYPAVFELKNPRQNIKGVVR